MLFYESLSLQVVHLLSVLSHTSEAQGHGWE